MNEIIKKEMDEIKAKGLNTKCETCGSECHNIAIGDNEGNCCSCHGEDEFCELCYERQVKKLLDKVEKKIRADDEFAKKLYEMLEDE